MREIKFRGQRLDSKTWVYGSMFNSIWRNSADGSRVCYIFPDNMLDDDNGGGDSWEDFISDAEQYEVDPATVGQYTGLKDKNGTEIYEGDILHEVATEQVVAIEYQNFQWGFIYTRNSIGYVWPNHPENFVVIGNIHSNPELIKQ